VKPTRARVGNGRKFSGQRCERDCRLHSRCGLLNDFDVVAAGPEKFEITSLAGDSTEHPVSQSRIHGRRRQEGCYPHYMLKEILEQPNTVRDAMRGRLNPGNAQRKLGGLNMAPPDCAT